MFDPYQEHLDSQPDSIAELDRGEAAMMGEERPDQAWILSDRDVWYANPFYKGPPVRHPEDYDAEMDALEAEQEARERGVEATPMPFEEPGSYLGVPLDEDLPF